MQNLSFWFVFEVFCTNRVPLPAGTVLSRVWLLEGGNKDQIYWRKFCLLGNLRNYKVIIKLGGGDLKSRSSSTTSFSNVKIQQSSWVHFQEVEAEAAKDRASGAHTKDVQAPERHHLREERLGLLAFSPVADLCRLDRFGGAVGRLRGYVDGLSKLLTLPLVRKPRKRLALLPVESQPRTRPRIATCLDR